jgi:hypothetical protein
MALACGKMTAEQFADGKCVVMHKNRRAEDVPPDDRPSNLEVGTHKENLNDPHNKRRTSNARSRRVRLTRVDTGETTVFESVKEAASFVGVQKGNLSHYLNGVQNMPRPMAGVWEASYEDAFEAPDDAIKLAGAAGDLWLIPSRPNEVFRRLKTGAFVPTYYGVSMYGYAMVQTEDGKLKPLHRLVFKTFKPHAFAEKLADMPPGSKESDLEVDHIDGDELNNSIDNLRLVDRAEHNRKHIFAVELMNDGVAGGVYDCAADAAKVVRGTDGQELNPSHIRGVCDGTRTNTGGRIFRWKCPELVSEMRVARIEKRKLRS